MSRLLSGAVSSLLIAIGSTQGLSWQLGFVRRMGSIDGLDVAWINPITRSAVAMMPLGRLGALPFLFAVACPAQVGSLAFPPSLVRSFQGGLQLLRTLGTDLGSGADLA